MKPTRLLLALSTALLLASLLLESLPLLLDRPLPALAGWLWWLLLAALLLATAADAIGLQRLPSPRLRREVDSPLALQHAAQVHLHVEPAGRWPRWLELFDHVPPQLEFELLPLRLRPAADSSRLSASYQVIPQQRGLCRFLQCEISLPGPLGLWQSRRLLPLHDEVRVYPAFARLYAAQLSAVEHWLGRAGVRQIPRRGDSLEFLQLREFRDGDSLRHIDWKATARKHQPITREYGEERDQQILLLLDGGRHLQGMDGQISCFDHALNACLLLAHVALRQGDAVGVLTCAASRPCFLPPAKGHGQLTRLLSALHDLQPGDQPADLTAAASELLTRQPRRALVILITNLRDEDDQQLPLAAAQIARRHRLVITSLREALLGQLTGQPVTSYPQALDYCAAIDYSQRRRQLHQRLQAQGVSVLEAAPEQLGPQLVNRYLQWKAAGTL